MYVCDYVVCFVFNNNNNYNNNNNNASIITVMATHDKTQLETYILYIVTCGYQEAELMARYIRVEDE